ncbi:hypothetical protein [Cupriavidus necator]
MKPGARRALLSQHHSDLADWPSPDVFQLDDKVGRQYLNRKLAVELYAENIPFTEIKTRTGLSADEVRRLVRRCKTPTHDGAIVGFYALLPSYRVSSYRRKKPLPAYDPFIESKSAGFSGALCATFERFPDIKKAIDSELSKSRRKGGVSRNRKKAKSNRQLGLETYTEIHAKFVKMLRDRGVAKPEWPFNTNDEGRKSIYRYLQKIELDNSSNTISLKYGEEAENNLSIGRGSSPLMLATVPFSIVELDYAVQDAPSYILVKDRHGQIHRLPVARWYLGILADVCTAGVLGAHISLETNPSADCALQTLLSCISDGWVAAKEQKLGIRIDLCKTNLDFVERGPTLIGNLEVALADQGFRLLQMDNAWCNIAGDVVNNAIDVFGCAIVFGAPRAWWLRPIIERINGKFAERGLHRLRCTYGSGPNDPRRRKNPEELAVEDEVDLETIIEILNSVVREHNTTFTGDRLFGATILDTFRRYVAQPELHWITQPLPQEIPAKLRLLMHRETVKVRGEKEKGRNQYVYVKYCRYHNERLSRDFSLLNQEVHVYIHRLDGRIAWAFHAKTFEFLGDLTPEAKWLHWQLPLQMRTLLMAKTSGVPRRRSEDIISGQMYAESGNIIDLNSDVDLSKTNALLIARFSRDAQAAPRTPSLPPNEAGRGQAPRLPAVNPRGMFRLTFDAEGKNNDDK